MTIAVIIIGDEILSGKRQDKHLAKIIEFLNLRGMQLSEVKYLGDDLHILAKNFKLSFDSYTDKNDLVICCGGIGGTPDDKTRQACAIALNQELVLHSKAKEQILIRIKQMQLQNKAPQDFNHSENLQRLTMGEFPVNADIIPNNYNNIPGFSISNHFFVPGFPVMSWPMIEWILDTKYKHLHHTNIVQTLSCFIPLIQESQLSAILFELEKNFKDITTFSLPSFGKNIRNNDNLEIDMGKESEWQTKPYIEVGVKGKSPSSKLLSTAFTQLTQKIKNLGYTIIDN